MTAPIFLDTNILIYSISRHPAEAEKRRRAIELLNHGHCALSVQVLQEFYVQATRASRPDPIGHDLAAAFIRTWGRFKIQDITLAVVNEALRLKQAHGFSYWDCAVVAAARAQECRELYTEDLSHGQVIEGLTIVNPFR